MFTQTVTANKSVAVSTARPQDPRPHRPAPLRRNVPGATIRPGHVPIERPQQVKASYATLSSCVTVSPSTTPVTMALTSPAGTVA